MKTRVQSFIANKKVLWNEGMTVALAWFEDDTLIINKGTNSKIRELIKNVSENRFEIKE